MEYIIIYLFTKDKKEENTLSKLKDEKIFNSDKYNKYIYEFFKENVISKKIADLSIDEFREFLIGDESQKYLIFSFNLSQQLDIKELVEYESIEDLDKNLYNLLTYKNNHDNKYIKNLFKAENTVFNKDKKYNFIIITENKNISHFKIMLKNNKIYENIFFNTNFNIPIINLIKESETILFNF